MKLFTKITVLFVYFTIIYNLHIKVPSRIIKTEEAINYGWNSFIQNEDFLKDPIKTLSIQEKIFDYKVDLAGKSYDNLVYSTSPYSARLFKTNNSINEIEMKQNESITILGHYTIPNGSYSFKKDVLPFTKNSKLKSTILNHSYTVLELQQKTRGQFPMLTPNFIRDVYNTFYKRPAELTRNENFQNLDVQQNPVILSEMVKFFMKYGTHYFKRLRYGFTCGYRQTKEGNAESSNPSDFTIGNCKVKDKNLVTKTCDINDPKLIKMDVLPLSNLFSKFTYSNSFVVDGKNLTEKEVDKIQTIMENIIEKISEIVKVTNFVVNDIQSYALTKANPTNPCFNSAAVSPLLKGVFNWFRNFSNKKQFMIDLKASTQSYPVCNIKNYSNFREDYNSPNKNFAISTNGELGLFVCNRKNFLLPLENEIDLTKYRFYEEIKFVAESDTQNFTDAGYKCKETWKFNDIIEKRVIPYHLCTKTTNNIFSKNIIKDIKFFSFTSGYKCFDKKLNTFMENFYYKCDCDMDFSLISDTKKQADTFLCISRLEDEVLDNIPDEKLPEVMYRRVKWIQPDEVTFLKKVNGKISEGKTENDEKNVS